MQLTLDQAVGKEITLSQRKVLFALRQLSRATMRDVSSHMLVSLNRISGRFSELERKGYIKRVGKQGKFTIYEAFAWPKDMVLE